MPARISVWNAADPHGVRTSAELASNEKRGLIWSVARQWSPSTSTAHYRLLFWRRWLGYKKPRRIGRPGTKIPGIPSMEPGDDRGSMNEHAWFFVLNPYRVRQEGNGHAPSCQGLAVRCLPYQAAEATGDPEYTFSLPFCQLIFWICAPFLKEKAPARRSFAWGANDTLRRMRRDVHTDQVLSLIAEALEPIRRAHGDRTCPLPLKICSKEGCSLSGGGRARAITAPFVCAQSFYRNICDGRSAPAT